MATKIRPSMKRYHKHDVLLRFCFPGAEKGLESEKERGRMSTRRTPTHRPTVKPSEWLGRLVCCLNRNPNSKITPVVTEAPIRTLLNDSMARNGMTKKPAVGRALAEALLERPLSPQQEPRQERRRVRFNPRPSRLSTMSKA